MAGLEIAKSINKDIDIDPKVDFDSWLDRRRELADERLTDEDIRELIIFDLECFQKTGFPCLEK